MVTLSNLQVSSLGPSTVASPLAMYVEGRRTNEYYVGEEDRILYDDTLELIASRGVALEDLPTFESGGPRQQIFFDPATTKGNISAQVSMGMPIQHELTKAEAGRILETLLDVVVTTVKKGGAVSIPGFGSFKQHSRAARTGASTPGGSSGRAARRT